MQIQDTIVAIATPVGVGGIGIIRLSGPKAFVIAKEMAPNFKKMPRYLQYVGLFESKEERLLDNICAVYCISPHSYTGEDVVELHLHASPYLLQKVLDLCVDFGARLAEPGEFTKQAFLNGKMNLIQAESVVDLINAQTDSEHHMALSHYQGHLYGHIVKLRQVLLDSLAHLQASIDFPDEVDPLPRSELKKGLENGIEALARIVKFQDFGVLIQEGIPGVIVGKPNVGKSSLFNALLGENKAIVSAIAGTTRDVLEARLQLNGLRFIIQDTAGLHDTKDYIEHLGIKKVKEKIKKAQLVFWVLDGARPFDEEDFLVYQKIKRKKQLYLLVNKSDQKQRLKLPESIKKLHPCFFISMKTKAGLQEFKQAVGILFRKTFDEADVNLLCNIRQIHCVKQVLKKLKQIDIDTVLDDLLCIDLKALVLKLGELTGDDLTEEVLDNIFSRFCVGK